MNQTDRDHQQGMYVGRDFDPANPTESEVFSLDFVNTLQLGETINSVTSIDLTVFQGVDANPNSHLTGNPIVSGTVVWACPGWRNLGSFARWRRTTTN
jgi:hypothetical protein